MFSYLEAIFPAEYGGVQRFDLDSLGGQVERLHHGLSAQQRLVGARRPQPRGPVQADAAITTRPPINHCSCKNSTADAALIAVNRRFSHRTLAISRRAELPKWTDESDDLERMRFCGARASVSTKRLRA